MPEQTGQATETRSVIVVGGGSGLGRAVAAGFARRGARVGLLGRREDALAETRDGLPGSGHVVRVADVTDARSITEAVASTSDQLGGLDVAVNTAGVFVRPGPVGDADLAAVADLFSTNVLGTYHAMHAEIGQMRKDGGGVIINYSSNIGAHGNRSGLAAYGASKAAVSAMSAAAAVDHVADGIRIVALSPGAADTSMSFRPGESEADRNARVAAAHPLGRVATLDEIVHATLFLASAEASFLVGTDLVIDGGMSAATRG